jgi:preprotein translocase subunit YajC
MSGGVLLLILIAFALIWIFLIRPSRRRQNEQLTMQEALEVGDEIVTAGGVYGTVTGLDEDEVAVEIAEGVVVRVARRAVAGVIPPEDELDEEPDGPQPEAEHEPENVSRS